jgi:hypothetical protein
MLEQSKCLLCGNDNAAREGADAGNRYLYHCDVDYCGQYEISRRAMRRLNEQASKAPLIMAIREKLITYRQRGDIPEIFYDDAGILTVRSLDMARRGVT